MDEEIERVACVDEFGEMFVVVVIQEYTGDGLPGFKRMRLADGSSSVNYIDAETFKIVRTGRIIRKAR